MASSYPPYSAPKRPKTRWEFSDSHPKKSSRCGFFKEPFPKHLQMSSDIGGKQLGHLLSRLTPGLKREGRRGGGGLYKALRGLIRPLRARLF